MPDTYDEYGYPVEEGPLDYGPAPEWGPPADVSYPPPARNYYEPIWADEYRAAGGLTFQETMQMVDQQRAAQQPQYAPQQPAQPQQPQYMDESQFISWPAYQEMVGGRLPPHEAYDMYVNSLAPAQMRNMGYSDDEIQQSIRDFARDNPPPEKDLGWFGNIVESFTGGVRKGTQFEKATGNLATGNLDSIAKGFTEQATGPAEIAPVKRFNVLANDPSGQASGWEWAKNFASAVVKEPQGFINSWIEQMGQSYPAMIGGGGGAAAGAAVGGPVGALIGLGVGAGAGSGSIEVGAQLMEGIAEEAQARGVDPRDEKGIRAMLSDPVVFEKLRNRAAIKGGVVGSVDGIMAALTGFMGKSAAAAAKAGRTGRATGLGVSGLLAESAAGAGGEALSLQATGQPLDWRQIGPEAAYELGPGGVHMATGAAIELLSPRQTQPGDNIGEGDVAGGDEQGPFVGPQLPPMVGPQLPPFVGPTQPPAPPFVGPNMPPFVGPNLPAGAVPGMDVTEVPPEEINITAPPGPPQFEGNLPIPGMEVTPLPMEQITIPPVRRPPPAPPMGPGPGGMSVETINIEPPAYEITEGAPLPSGIPPNAAVAYLTREPSTDLNVKLNDRNNLVQWLTERGVNIKSKEQIDTIETLLNVPVNSRQEMIAHFVEELQASNEVGAEPLANALLAISRLLPKDRPTAAQARANLEADLPGVPPTEIPAVVGRELAVNLLDDQEQPNAAAQQPTPAPVAKPVSPLAPPSVRAAAAITPKPTRPKRSRRPAASGAGGGLGDIVGQLLGRTAVDPQAPVSESGSGVGAGVDQEGAAGGGRRGPPSGGTGGTAQQNTDDAGAKPNSLAGARGVPEVTLTGAAARAEALAQAGQAVRERVEGRRGLANAINTPSIDAMLEAAVVPKGARVAPEAAPTTVPGTQYGNQKRDLANTMTLAQERAERRAKAQTGGLTNKQKREAKRKMNVLSRQGALDATTMSKEEYEAKYPGRNHEADTDAVVKASNNRTTSTSQAGSKDRYGSDTPIDRNTLGLMQQMPTSDVLDLLAARANNPIARAAALAMKGLGLDVRFIVGKPPGSPAAGKHTLITRPSTGHGKVDQFIHVDPNHATIELIIHEYVHAGTVWAYLYGTSPQHKAMRKQMDALFNFVKQDSGYTQSEFYGLTDTEEFISEALTNGEFQKFLATIKMPNEPTISVWTAFKRAVLNVFGNGRMDNALAHALASVEDLFAAPPLVGARAQAPPAATKKGSTNTPPPKPAPPPNAAPNAPPPAAPPAANAAANSVPRGAIVGTKNGARSYIAYAKNYADPNTTYTMYPVDAQNYRGIKGAGVKNLTRAQVEAALTADGSQITPPSTDTTVKSGTPKNSATVQVGYDGNGNLRTIGFQQKDGTWTYYESDDDVRTDPNSRVVKGLSHTAVQRYIAGAGFNATPPIGGAVAPGASNPTQMGYVPASGFRRWIQDVEATLSNIGGHIDRIAVLRNSMFHKVRRQAMERFVKPAAEAGAQVMTRFGKTQEEIETLMQNLHVIERMQTKMQQFYRGNLQGQALANKQAELAKKQQDAQNYVNAARSANPSYVTAVEQEVAPKLKALADHSIDLAAAYGLININDAQAIKAAYDYYVPLQTGDRTSIHKAATGNSVTGDVTFARMIEQLEHTIARGEQNKVRVAVYNQATGAGLFNEKTQSNPVSVGPTYEFRYDKATNSINEKTGSFVFDPNAVDVFINGDRIRMKIDDPSLLEALHAYKGEQRETGLTMGISALANINRLVSIGKTSLNPAWPPFNFLRDVLTSNINLPAGVSRARYWAELAKPSNYAAVFANVAKEAFGSIPSGLYADAKDAGAFIDHRAYLGLDPIASSMESMFRPGPGSKTKDLGRKAFNILSIVAQTAESVPRMAMYKAALAGNPHPTQLQKDQAAYAAKTASVNFEKRGRAALSNYWIFGNAKMQGVHAMLKTAERAGLVKSTVGASGIVLLGAAAAALGQEWSDRDKDGKSKYTKIPDAKKDSMLLLKADGYGIPIPQEIAPLYVTGQVIVEAATGNISVGKATARWLTSVMNNAWPGSIAQADPIGHNANMADFVVRMALPSQLAPLYDTATNTNTFGREVVSGLKNKKEQGIPLSEMGSVNENQLAVNAAKGLYSVSREVGVPIDVAPQQLKIWHNYFNPLTEPISFVNDLFGGREPKYVGDVVNPLERKFKGMATEFYDQEQFDEILAKAKRAEYLAKNGGIDKLSPEDKLLAQQSAMLKRVDSDSDSLFKGYKLMTPERRKLLNERKRELVLGGIRRYNEARDRAGLN